eukprot:gene9020-10578_t
MALPGNIVDLEELAIESEKKKKKEDGLEDEDDYILPSNHTYSFTNQFSALFKKSIAYQKRQYKTNLMQALVPVLMISIMSLVQLATPPIYYAENIDPVSMPPPFVFPPSINYTVPYLLSDQVGNGIMGQCCQQNNSGLLGYFTTSTQVSPDPNYPAIGLIPTEALLFQQYSSLEMLDKITYRQGSSKDHDFLMGFQFNRASMLSNSLDADMVLYSNNTISSSSIINAMHNALFRAYTQNPTASIVTGMKEFPYHANEEKKDMIQPQENFWYLFMMSFCMVVFTSNVVYEKENRLRESMKMSGLRMRIYWLVQYIFNFTLYMIIVFVAIAFAYIMKFRFFTQTSFTVYFVLFLLFGMTQIAFSFFISVFFSSVYTATVVSFVYIIFTALSSNLLNNAFIENPDTSLATFIITALVPHVAFHRAISYISLAYVGNSPGLTWTAIFQHHQMPSLYGLLFGEFLIFSLLHQYLEMVMPSSYGVRYHPLFFLQKSFWHAKIHGGNIDFLNMTPETSDPSDPSATTIEMVPPDVLDEQRYTCSKENTATIKLMALSKNFKVLKQKLVAVDQLTLSVERGQCFGILGPNGAGKTTTLSILSGLYSPSSGTAIIDGKNIANNISGAQQSLGVCPQDDVLWSEMSGREHLLFFGRMKNLNGSQLSFIVDKSLSEVMLTEAQHKPVREYSGGMKRRLSLAISLIGSPAAILLDEPTTGVDPFSRRIVWDVIASYKSKCAIILTTHNMDEAEILCDRVCIINKGAMKCIGRNSDLKTRYGAGHTLSVSTTSDTPIHQFITDLIPNVKLIHEISLSKSYAVPRTSIKLSNLFKAIQENKERFNISDWGICQSGLEEVLLQATDENHSSSPSLV